jgi:beta-aspartyl-peptidase (threonine type)
MKKYALLFVLIFFCLQCSLRADERHYAIIIHGGAGATRASFAPGEEVQVRETMKQAVLHGKKVLETGGSSLDAVETTIRILEDSPLFNAGKGAVFTNAGTNELDAAIMDGSTLKAGAVAGVTHIKNPISLARIVMEKSKHLLLAESGAEEFAKENGVALVDPKYFFTQKRWDSLQKEKQKERTQTQKKDFGTVGVVALDIHGNIAAGTSTGGLTNKRFGRIGDSPIIGAGTYANNQTCGVSCSGTGEFFMRTVAAYDVSALMEYKNLSLNEAAKDVLAKITRLGGDGGLIALDSKGHTTVQFNTEGMTTAYLDDSGNPVVRIYKEEFSDHH